MLTLLKYKNKDSMLSKEEHGMSGGRLTNSGLYPLHINWLETEYKTEFWIWNLSHFSQNVEWTSH